MGASFDFHDTPNFIIGNSDGSNAKIIRGAQPFAFQSLVDERLDNNSIRANNTER